MQNICFTRKKQKMKKILLSCLLLNAFLNMGHAQEYRSIEIVHPQGTFHQSGLNSLGQICGSVLVDNVNFINHALRYEPDGTFTMLTLGEDGESATASDMNDLGHVIGTIYTNHFTNRYVIWESADTFRELEQPEGFYATFLKDINNKGEAVGHTATWGLHGTRHADRRKEPHRQASAATSSHPRQDRAG